MLTLLIEFRDKLAYTKLSRELSFLESLALYVLDWLLDTFLDEPSPMSDLALQAAMKLETILRKEDDDGIPPYLRTYAAN